MTLFLTASSFHSIFTQVPKTFNSSVALQVGFLKHLGDVVLHSSSGFILSLFLHVIQTDWWWSDQISVWSTGCLRQKSHWIITINGKMNVCKCKLIFPTDTLQQNIEITDLKLFLAAENTRVLIILATTVDILFLNSAFSVPFARVSFCNK